MSNANFEKRKTNSVVLVLTHLATLGISTAHIVYSIMNNCGTSGLTERDIILGVYMLGQLEYLIKPKIYAYRLTEA